MLVVVNIETGLGHGRMLQHDILHFLLSGGQRRLGEENYVPVLCKVWIGSNHSIPVPGLYTTRIRLWERLHFGFKNKNILLEALKFNFTQRLKD